MEIEEKGIEVARLEERTRALEKCDRRHYIMEVILFAAILALTLLVVASCTIATPEKVDNKEWVYTEVQKVDNLTFTLNEDKESVTAEALGKKYVVTKNDSKDIVSLSMTLKIKVEENKITVIRDDNTVLGYFEYR